MEHLFLPAGAQRSLIPYGGYSDYLGVPFLEYPKRAGNEFFLLAKDGLQAAASHFPEITHEDKVPFLETWFFGGLLQEVFNITLTELGLPALFDHQDFVRIKGPENEVVSHATFFCTSELVRLLTQWMGLIQERIHQCKPQLLHLKTCLNLIQNVLSFGPKLTSSVKLVLCSVAEIITVATQKAFAHAEYLVEGGGFPNFWPFLGWGQTNIQRAINNGWCPYDASRILHETATLQTAIFLSYLDRKDPTGIFSYCPSQTILQTELPIHHAHCLATDCKSNENSREPQQSRLNCKCPPTLLQAHHRRTLAEILEADGVPLVQFRMGNHVRGYDIEIVPYAEGEKYVAISHVWADGLGNSSENDMLACRWASLVESLAQLWTSANLGNPEKITCWIDTICCPVTEGYAKIKVLGQMRQIYENATEVFVLDGELQNVCIDGMTDLEVLLRVMYSRWMTRLWTLQEGFLAKALWVKFKNGAFNLDLRFDAVKASNQPINNTWIVGTASRLYWSVRKRLAKEQDFDAQMWEFFQAAIQKRRVTDPSDEPICLCTLLDLDTKMVAETPLEDRMKVFWYLLGSSKSGIPERIIFDSRPKLSVVGYRWAPVSLLNSAAPMFSFGSRKSKISQYGLLVQRKGFILRRTGPLYVSTAVGQELPKLNYRLPANCYIRDQTGRWYHLILEDVSQDSLMHVSMSELLGERQDVGSSLISSAEDTATEEDGNLSTDVPPRSLSIQEQIRLVDTPKYALVMRDDESTIGVLVEIESRANDCLQIKILKQILCNPAHVEGKIFEAACKAAQALRPNHGADSSQNQESRRLDLDEAEILRRAKGIVDSGTFPFRTGGLAHIATETDAQQHVACLIVLILQNHYHLDADALSEDQQWCFT